MKQDNEPRISPVSQALERSLQRALRNHNRAKKKLKTAPVHDFRVALRRCRTLAEGLSAIDPDPVWRRLRKTSRRLQRGMSDLRDVQVLERWLNSLRLATGPASGALARHLKKRERTARREARKSLDWFPRKKWKRWSRRLPERAELIPLNQRRIAHLVLEQLTRVNDLHKRWAGQPSADAWHALRVSVKRFRYMVESFLPERSEAWSAQLQHAQDLLGEGHDLDVLHDLLVKLSRKKSLPKAAVAQALRRVDSAARTRRKEYVSLISRAHRNGRRSAGGQSESANTQTLWDDWGRELQAMASVNRQDVEGPARSIPRRASRATARANQYPHTRRRISSAP